MDLPSYEDSAPDLTCGITADHDFLRLQNVREAIEAVFRANPGKFPTHDLPCPCGMVHVVPGRWFIVAEALVVVPLVAPQVYFRCPQCGGISVPDGFDQLAGKMDFFQLINDPAGGEVPLVECVTYDLGGLEAALGDVGEGPKGN